MRKLNECDLLVDVISQNLQEFLGIYRLSQDRTGSGICHIIHIRLFESYEFPFAVLHHTGSTHFNITMRQEAIRKGFSLSEYEFKTIDSNRVLKVNSEENIFRHMNIPYVPPQNRNYTCASMSN